MTRHELIATPETVHWGHFDATLTPVLSIDPGDEVVVHTVSGGAPGGADFARHDVAPGTRRDSRGAASGAGAAHPDRTDLRARRRAGRRAACPDRRHRAGRRLGLQLDQARQRRPARRFPVRAAGPFRHRSRTATVRTPWGMEIPRAPVFRRDGDGAPTAARGASPRSFPALSAAISTTGSFARRRRSICRWRSRARGSRSATAMPRRATAKFA